MLRRLDVLGHLQSAERSLLDLLLLENTRLQLLSLLADLLRLFDDGILALDVRISLFQLDNSLVAASLEVLVQEDSVRQHLLNVADFDRHVGRQVAAVDLDVAWVVLNVAPDRDLLNEEDELATSLEVQRPVLLHMDKRHMQQIRAARNETLELDAHRSLRLEVPVDCRARHSDLLAVVAKDERAEEAVVRLRDGERHAPGNDDVEVFELVSLGDNGGNRLFIVHLLEGVIRLAVAQRVKVDLAGGDVRLALVDLPHLLGVELCRACQLWDQVVPMCAEFLLSSLRRPEREVLHSYLMDQLFHGRLLDWRRDIRGSGGATTSALRRFAAEHAGVHAPQNLC